MKYLKTLTISFAITGFIYYLLARILIDAPVSAEYWVNEMITIKKELAKPYRGQRKIIIAGGSSTLFGIDAETASKRLGLPVLNFGLHAGLPLEKILQEARVIVDSGDIIVLALEPSYYECTPKFDSWRVTNIIAWDHESFASLSTIEKIHFITYISPTLLGEMVVAKSQQKYQHHLVAERTSTLDEVHTLSKFHTEKPPAKFSYSAYNLNHLGDMMQIDGSIYKGDGYNINRPSYICPDKQIVLTSYTNDMQRHGIQVFFANTPYLSSIVDSTALQTSESEFRKQLVKIGPIIDSRKDLILDRRYFFNSNLHLNTEGRRLRTEAFTTALNRTILSKNARP